MTISTVSDQPFSRRRAWSRGVLAGPVCFITAFVVMAGAALWYPAGPAQINNIAVPIIFFPAIWAALFFYLMLDRKLGRAWGVAMLLLLVHGGFIAQHVMAAQAAKKAAAPVAVTTEGASP